MSACSLYHVTMDLLEKMSDDLRTALLNTSERSWEDLTSSLPRTRAWTRDQYCSAATVVVNHSWKLFYLEAQRIIRGAADNICEEIIRVKADQLTVTYQSTTEKAVVLVKVHVQTFHNFLTSGTESHVLRATERIPLNLEDEDLGRTFLPTVKPILQCLHRDVRVTLEVSFRDLQRQMEQFVITVKKRLGEKEIGETLKGVIIKTSGALENFAESTGSKVNSLEEDMSSEEWQIRVESICNLGLHRLQAECTRIVNAANRQVLDCLAGLQMDSHNRTCAEDAVTSMFQNIIFLLTSKFDAIKSLTYVTREQAQENVNELRERLRENLGNKGVEELAFFYYSVKDEMKKVKDYLSTHNLQI